jgi:hypothetical protein
MIMPMPVIYCIIARAVCSRVVVASNYVTYIGFGFLVVSHLRCFARVLFLFLSHIHHQTQNPGTTSISIVFEYGRSTVL